MIEGGTGGSRTTEHGDWFEYNADLGAALKSLGFELKEIPSRKGSKTKAYEVSKERVVIGILLSKSRLYDVLTRISEDNSTNWSNPLSASLWPDEAFLNTRDGTLHILEKKAMKVAGSVDEKLQTFPFKIEQYERLVEGLEVNAKQIKIHYAYILSFWFQKPQYKDVLNYMTRHGVEYWIQETKDDWNLPISIIGL